MTQFSIIKNGLVPHDDEARTTLSKHKIGAVVDVEVLNPINSAFNAKMMVAIEKLAKASGISAKAMRAKLLILTGRFELLTITPTKKIMVPSSMSRSAMTQAEREQFWDDLREIARAEILPQLNATQQDEINAIFDDRLAGETDYARHANKTESAGT